MNLTRAIAVGGQLEPLLSELSARQDRCHALRRIIADWTAVLPGRFDRKTIDQKVRSYLAHWRGLLTKHVEDGRHRWSLTDGILELSNRDPRRDDRPIRFEWRKPGVFLSCPAAMLIAPKPMFANEWESSETRRCR
jgi:hypothetical protein